MSENANPNAVTMSGAAALGLAFSVRRYDIFGCRAVNAYMSEAASDEQYQQKADKKFVVTVFSAEKNKRHNAEQKQLFGADVYIHEPRITAAGRRFGCPVATPAFRHCGHPVSVPARAFAAAAPRVTVIRSFRSRFAGGIGFAHLPVTAPGGCTAPILGRLRTAAAVTSRLLRWRSVLLYKCVPAVILGQYNARRHPFIAVF